MATHSILLKGLARQPDCPASVTIPLVSLPEQPSVRHVKQELAKQLPPGEVTLYLRVRPQAASALSKPVHNTATVSLVTEDAGASQPRASAQSISAQLQRSSFRALVRSSCRVGSSKAAS